MSFCITVPEFDHILVPASQPTCPYCGKLIHQTFQPTSVPIGGTSPSLYTTASSLSSTALLLPQSPQYMIIDPEIESYTRISVPGHLISLSKSFTLQLGKQSQNNRFALSESNWKEVNKIRSGRLISKNWLKTKGKFDIGAKKEVKVSDNQTVDIFVGTKGQPAGNFALKVYNISVNSSS